MSSADGEELRALRERAFGPHADLHLDLATWDRLRSLERETSAEFPSSPDTSGGEGSSTLTPELHAGADDTGEREPSPSSHAPRRISVRGWLWAATVIAVVLACVTAVTLTQRARLAPFAPQAELVAQLTQTTGVALPGYFDDDPASPPTTYETFGGMGAVVTSTTTGSDGSHCLYILRADTLAAASTSSLDGPLLFGCSAGAFPAVVQFTVTADDPAELRAAVSVGGAIQFVFDPAVNEVVVFTVAG